MNFSKKMVEARAKHLESPSTHRKYKFRLIVFRLLLVAVVLSFCIGVSALSGIFRSIVDSAPDIDRIQVVPQGYTTSIRDADGKTIQTLVGKNANREYVTLDQIPSNLQNAFIAIEDERFFEHNGIDLQGIARAFFDGIQNGGTFNQGASTLTQQLLKNQVFGGGEETSFIARLERKIEEQYLALQLEQKCDKKQILEYYLNTINLGQNTLGVQAASKRYFGKEVSDLTLSECAVLAGITKNPTAYNPITHPNHNRERRTTVLTSMKEQGYITNDDYTLAMQDDVYSRIQAVNKEVPETSATTSYFTDALIEQVIQDLKTRLGYTETQAYNALYSRGLTIYTTQDTRMQKVCDRIVNDKKYYPADSTYFLTYQLTIRKKNGIEQSFDQNSMIQYFTERKKKKISPYYSSKAAARRQIKQFKKAVLNKNDTIIAENINLVIQPQVSFVLMNQYTGEVKALCGGRGQKTASRTLNRATGTTRQPGSTFKVLSTYLPALDTAGMTLATVQDDAPYHYPGTKRKVKNWYGDSYRGLSSIRSAIADSMNVVTVKTLEQVGLRTGYDYLLNLGFTTIIDTYTDNSGKTYTDIALPMALGGLTKGVTNLELTGAFASIANGGTRHQPVFYTKIIDHDGNVLIDNTTENARRIMKDSTAWLLTSAMSDVVNKGSGTRLKFKHLKMNQAGKTGTSTNNRDLWFVGYTPYLTAGIWCGYDTSLKQTSSNYHKDMWRDIMEELNKKYTNKAFKRPSSVTTATICTKCGKLAIDGLCSRAVGGSCEKIEYFAKDTVPTETCDCHVRCRICKSSGHLAGDNCPESQIYTAIYLQKNESSSKAEKNSSQNIKTADTPLIIPPYLSNSLCEVHN